MAIQLNRPIRDRIHAAAQNASGSVLDRVAYTDTQIGIKHFCLSADDLVITNYLPINAIVSATHQNFRNSPESTWREIVSRLECGDMNFSQEWEDWPSLVFDYWDKPIGNNPFPAKTARNALDISAWGGAAHCACGVHRMVAGMAYLADKHNDNAYFQGVNIKRHRIIPELLSDLNGALKTGRSVSSILCPFELRCNTVDTGEYPLIVFRFTRKLWQPDQYFVLTNEQNLYPYQKCLGNHKWINLPHDVLERMLDDSWLP